MDSQKNILMKINAIMAEINYIQKDKSNSFHGYKYASEAAIKEACHASFVKHKVVFSFSVNKVTDLWSTTGGEHVVLVECAWTLSDVESGESLSGVAVGTGSDKGDKAVYKAITGALKYALTANLLIPTGEDPENESEKKAEAPTMKITPSYGTAKPITPSAPAGVVGTVTRAMPSAVPVGAVKKNPLPKYTTPKPGDEPPF